MSQGLLEDICERPWGRSLQGLGDRNDGYLTCGASGWDARVRVITVQRQICKAVGGFANQSHKSAAKGIL